MSDNDTDNTRELTEGMEQLKEEERKRNQFLMQLLDRQREKRNHQFAIRAQTNAMVSYVTTVSLTWVAQHVGFAKDLPIWERKKDRDGKIRIDEETMEELRQREPDWSRQQEIARYIALRGYHKFPPILVTAWKPWVNEKSAKEWGDDGVALESSIDERPLDSLKAYVDLDCTDTHFYVLDGQHRLMAIQGLNALVHGEILQRRQKTGKPIKGTELTREDLVEDMAEALRLNANEATARLPKLMNESIGIEIFPAVQKGETSKLAVQRLRSVFVDVNLTAKALTKGTLVQLDENNGFSIVARRTMVKNDLLKHGRVEIKKHDLTENAHEYTTLNTLSVIAERYLGTVSPFTSWAPQVKGDPWRRPDPGQLDGGEKRLMDLFKQLAELPSHESLIQDRNKSAGDYRQESDSENILFRPIAQMALAEALPMVLVRQRKLPDVIDLLKKAETEGKLRLRTPDSVWFGVLCDVISKKMRRSDSRKLCTRLFVHLLAGGTPHGEDLNQLLEDFRLARRASTEGMCIGFEGKEINAEKLRLPSPW